MGRGDHLLHREPPVSSAKEDAIKVRKGPVQKIGKQASDPEPPAAGQQDLVGSHNLRHVGPPDKRCS